MGQTSNPTNINYFNYYQVFESESENGSKDLIPTYTDVSITSYSITDFNSNIQKWFWVSVSYILGRDQLSDGVVNEFNSALTTLVLEYDDGFHFIWSKNNDFDFQKCLILIITECDIVLSGLDKFS